MNLIFKPDARLFVFKFFCFKFEFKKQMQLIRQDNEVDESWNSPEIFENDRHLLFKAVSGSHAYGLNRPESDVDIRGIFVLPREEYYGLHYTDQITDRKNDIIFYELKKMVGLLAKNNPNALELLLTPADCVEYRHPLMDLLPLDLFLSQKCRHTFAGYAMSQVKRARGLNKKIVNPLPKERKSVLDFCFVAKDAGSTPVRHFLRERGLRQSDCGLAKVANMKGMYALYHHPDAGYEGIVRDEAAANDVALSSIPKGEPVQALLYFNKDAYSVYCKEYREYWQWVENRNEARYQATLDHGKRYDAKNMMHTFRLLHMAEEIATSGAFTVHRVIDRNFLLRVRAGEYEYEDLVALAEAKIRRIDGLFERSKLPEQPDLDRINQALVTIRERFYQE